MTRAAPDGSAGYYALYNQRLEGTQTFHLGDFKSEDAENY